MARVHRGTQTVCSSFLGGSLFRARAAPLCSKLSVITPTNAFSVRPFSVAARSFIPDWPALEQERARWYPADVELVRDLRSDHAGETGAVWIYRGAECAMSLRKGLYGASDGVTGGTVIGRRARAFVAEHRATEEEHLALFDQLLPARERSSLLPLWRLAGFTLGFAPTLVGPRVLFSTVAHVETFVEVHYHAHLDPLLARGEHPALAELVSHCCADEVHHKEEAAELMGSLKEGSPLSLLDRAWGVIVGGGSQLAVYVCRYI
eukprot:TRINITY_DN14689_c0_g1_i1.p1 TRINITY_DN14689_c0_g1~~TRINITY_DN14689_c0_g1_i1.p1  ORF type:complete len:280 (+),score=32.88 TRINITY_DN14689_c0_g1_i1:52-840(+)